MTGEHVQDQLLDLAYGELPPDRAAEVEAHLATCDACRAERDDIERTRALVAPLRAIEQPRPGFDDRILRSARAEALLGWKPRVGAREGIRRVVEGVSRPAAVIPGQNLGRRAAEAPLAVLASKELATKTSGFRDIHASKGSNRA